MFGGLNRLLAATFVAAGVLVVLLPSSALAGCNGRPSAANVYSPCLPDGGGGKSSKTAAHTGAGHTSTPPQHISHRAANALKRAGGKDRRLLATLLKGSGQHRLLPAAGGTAAAASTPTALGSVFDLGSGPTALLIALVGTAVLLLAASGVHGWRRRSHRP